MLNQMTLLKGDFHSRIKKRFYKSKSSLKNWKSHYNVKLQIPDTDHTYKRGYLRPYFPPPTNTCETEAYSYTGVPVHTKRMKGRRPCLLIHTHTKAQRHLERFSTADTSRCMVYRYSSIPRSLGGTAGSKAATARACERKWSKICIDQRIQHR